MLLAYVDESYTKERYLIAALLVPDREANSLTAALDKVVRDAMFDFGHIHDSAELHGYDLVAGKGDWTRLAVKVRARIAFTTELYKRLLTMMSRCSSAASTFFVYADATQRPIIRTPLR